MSRPSFTDFVNPCDVDILITASSPDVVERLERIYVNSAPNTSEVCGSWMSCGADCPNCPLSREVL